MTNNKNSAVTLEDLDSIPAEGSFADEKHRIDDISNIIDPMNSLIKPAEAYGQEIYDSLKATDEGYSIPFIQKEGQYAGQRYPLRFLPKDITVWSGSGGTGKSLLVGMFVLDWIHQGARVCLGSFEMSPARTLERMARQYFAKKLTLKNYQDVMDFWHKIDTRLTLFSEVGEVSIHSLEQFIFSAVNRFGCDTFVFDPLMRFCPDELDAQNFAIKKLCSLAQKYEVHIHIVHHMRKKPSSDLKHWDFYDSLDISNVKGASGIVDNASNVITMARHLGKQKRYEEKQEWDDSLPDIGIRIVKNRHLGTQAFIPLWYDKRSLTLCDSPERNNPIDGIFEQPF